MLITRGALEPGPGYAVVPEHVVTAVLRELGGDDGLRGRLDRAFRRLESEQPALAGFLSTELAHLDTPSAQTAAYFLFLTVCTAFRDTFGQRLAAVAERDLDGALQSLLADGEVRSQMCPARSYSQDVLAQWQPALMRLVHAEIDESRGAAEVDTVLQVLLVLIVTLTRAVAPQ
jgi:hypothetical protein